LAKCDVCLQNLTRKPSLTKPKIDEQSLQCKDKMRRDIPAKLYWRLLILTISFVILACGRRRVVLHVGPHKTGSTQIQVGMCEHIRVLAKFNWSVPICKDCDKCMPKMFAGVAFHYGGNQRQSEFWGCGSVNIVSCIMHAMQEHPQTSVFISSEEFDNLSENEIRHMSQTMLRDYEVTIVFFYRSSVRHILSYFSEVNRDVDNGQLATLQEFMFELSDVHPRRGFGGLYLKEMARKYINVFGPKAIHAISFDAIQAANVSPFAALATIILNINISESTNRVANRGGGAWLISASRFVVDIIQFSTLRKVNTTCLPFLREAIKNIALPIKCTDVPNAFSDKGNIQFMVDQGISMHFFNSNSTRKPERVCDVDRTQLRKHWTKWASSIHINHLIGMLGRQCLH